MLLARKISARAGSRHARRLTLADVDHLMSAAEKNGLSRRGNGKWLTEHRNEYWRCYLIPMPDFRLRSSNVRCMVVFIDRRDRAVWMSLDVRPWALLKLRRLRGIQATLALSALAANSPVVQWDGSTRDHQV